MITGRQGAPSCCLSSSETLSTPGDTAGPTSAVRSLLLEVGPHPGRRRQSPTWRPLGAPRPFDYVVAALLIAWSGPTRIDSPGIPPQADRARAAPPWAGPYGLMLVTPEGTPTLLANPRTPATTRPHQAGRRCRGWSTWRAQTRRTRVRQVARPKPTPPRPPPHRRRPRPHRRDGRRRPPTVSWSRPASNTSTPLGRLHCPTPEGS